MTKPPTAIAILAVLVLQGCSFFEITDRYGNTYGGFFNYGNQYQWQLGVCHDEVTARNVAEALRQRYMQCCMWRHGVPIDDSNGCEAPPFSG